MSDLSGNRLSFSPEENLANEKLGKLQKENEELKKMIEVLNDENKMHIKLLEKINDWATAGNINNYSQLCDELEKIQEEK